MAKKKAAKRSTAEQVTALLKDINGKYGAGTLLPAAQAKSLVMSRIPIGIPRFDIDSGGGIPRSRITVVKGQYSAGKTALCLKAAAAFQRHCRFCAKCIVRITLMGEVIEEDCECGAREPMMVLWHDAEHCLAEGTLVYEADEKRSLSVEELFEKGEFQTLSFDEDGMFRKVRAAVTDSGVRPVYLIKTVGGRVTKLTGNHRVSTDRGYVLVEGLVPGDVVYSPRRIDTPGVDSEDSRYRLLGLHLGDGSHGEPSISNVDGAVERDIKDIAKSFGSWTTRHAATIDIVSDREEFRLTKELLTELWNQGGYVSEIAQRCGCSVGTLSRYLDEFQVCDAFDRRSRAGLLKAVRSPEIVDPDPAIHKGRKNEAHLWLERFDCFHQYSKDRRLPKGLEQGQLAQVLAGLFMADGTSVDPEKQPRAQASFSTSSRRLAEDVRVALMRFGIYSATSLSTKDDYDPNYRVSVSGVENVRAFLACIPIYSYKRDRLERAVGMLVARSRLRTQRNTVLLEVKSVERLPREVQTYDVMLDVESFSQQNFLADGLLIHNSFDKDWAERWGLDVDKVLVVQTEYAEQGIDVTDLAIRSGAVDLVVVDSVAALTPAVEVEESSEKWQMGVAARLMNKALRKWTSGMNSGGLLSETQCTIILINQMRLNLGGYGASLTSPGGKGIDFFESLEVRLSKKQDGWLEDSLTGRSIALDVEYLFVKNKTAPARRAGEYRLYFVDDPAGGFSVGDTNYAEQLINLAAFWGIVKKATSWYTLPDGQKAQGSAKIAAILMEDDSLLADIEKRVWARELAWTQSGDTEGVVAKKKKDEEDDDDDG